ncbi:type I-C CRISPR-associated protein Cas8c/Csd1 [uncultured Oscillibacter sp.]|uniref:type I-C CRISPR-associated protein Cas8c/Csd1 n=1 Tax=uncultured Oscillibacter sp. TaxID=876091 RepID=UPI0025D24BD6|nr:type I-C CRISPR-associated protein Cas8c/Csd1 [uncultured Oscillibacter sp.]
MILQALVGHYEDLVARGEIAQPGWTRGKAAYALCLDDQGRLVQVASLLTEPAKGKKPVPRAMERLPAPVKRSVDVTANFLCDNSGYLLGIDGKGNPQRTRKCFAAGKALHERLLTGVDSPAARAVLAFFQTWEPEAAAAHPALLDAPEAVSSGANLVFRYDGAFVHEDPAVREAWQAAYDEAEDGPRMTCLVTGREAVAEAVHPAIRGVQGAQSSGAALVSFNAPAFCSYGKEQNYNAPVGKYAAFAYTAALNHLLADREHVIRVGDTTVLCWSEGGEDAYPSVFGAFAFGARSGLYTERELRETVQRLLRGSPVQWEGTLLDDKKPFYVLGLAPNAARLSVRFFLRDSFGGFLHHVQAHYDRLEIERPAYDKFETLPIWKVLGETVNQNTRDKAPVPGMSGELLRSVLLDAPYPATLLNGAVLRIRAEHAVTRGRAAILKAYYLQNTHRDVPKEVLTVSLNPECTDVPYTLGRLFSVLEAVQSAANPRINTTIVDRYFNTAASTPGRIFPVLLSLTQKHLRKLGPGGRVFYQKKITELLGILAQELPPRLNLPQQGAFQLGYYHQTQKRYAKKEENGHV